MKTNFTFLLVLFVSLTSYGQTTITHSNSQIVTPNIGITCAQNTSGITLYNKYFGVFDLANDFEIMTDWRIQAVEIGIEDANNLLDGDYQIEISAFTTDNATPNGSLELLGEGILIITSDDELSVVSMPFTDDVVVPAGEVLLIEIEVFGDGASVFRLGATDVEANDESWGFAPDCGFDDPITYNDANFLNVWNIINVIGDFPTGLGADISNSIEIFPNPVVDIVHIRAPFNLDDMSLTLMDILGHEMIAEQRGSEIDMSGLKRGTYLLHMQTSQGHGVKLIVKN